MNMADAEIHNGLPKILLKRTTASSPSKVLEK